MDRIENLLVLVRAGDGENPRVTRRDDVGLCAETAGDDDLAVLVQGFADGLKAFIARAVEKTTGVDEDEVSARVIRGDLVALGAQARDDAFAIDQRLRTAERDDADPGLVNLCRGWGGFSHCAAAYSAVRALTPAAGCPWRQRPGLAGLRS
ncbi:MAG TPA: hypothetical protein VG937_34420 [Polyangiaceae bacterium]|nr:hypothetical protein [Polyangiaceae bacterium]